MLNLIAFLATASAGSVPISSMHIDSVSEEARWDFGGNWTRLVLNEAGNTAMFAAGGEYWKAPLHEDLIAYTNERVAMTGRQDLEDHGWFPCPDGSFFHLASASKNKANDSAFSFIYDANLNLIHDNEIEMRHPEYVFNDMPGICHNKGRFAAYIDFDRYLAVVYSFDEEGDLLNTLRIPELPLPEGGSFIQDPVRKDLALVTSTPEKDGLYVNWLDWDLKFQGSKRILDGDHDVAQYFWPQGAQVVGDRIMLSFLRQPQDAGYIGEWGNLWIAIFDLEWRLIEKHPLTYDAGPGGTNRPGLELMGDTLYVSYDEMENHPPGDIQPRVLTVKLNLDAFSDPNFEYWEPTLKDTADPATDTGPDKCTGLEDEDEEGHEHEHATCTCSSSPFSSGSWVAFFATFALLRRRQDVESAQVPLSSSRSK